MLRHNNKIVLTEATRSRNRVFVRNVMTARDGGRLAFAAFQLIPPFGSNIAKNQGRSVSTQIGTLVGKVE